MKTLVIAGTHEQAMNWIKNDCANKWVMDQSASLSDYIIVDDVNRIRGISDPTGVFIGTWRERTDLEPIFQQLLISTDIRTKTHRTLTNLWGQWKDKK